LTERHWRTFADEGLMVTESVASGVAFGGVDVAFAMRRRRLRRDLPAPATIKISGTQRNSLASA